MMLNNLPLEVLLMIFSNLQSKDRHNFAATTPRLYATFQTYLYKEVTLFSWPHAANQARKLLWTVTNDPRLAEAVQILHLHAWGTAADPAGWNQQEGDENPALGFDGDHNLQNLVDQSIIPREEQQDLIQMLKNGIDDAWLALLLPHLRNIRKITIVWPYGAERVLDMLWRAAKQHKTQAEQPPASSRTKAAPFSHLQEAYATWYDTEGGAYTRFMHPFFAFSSMQTIGGFRLDELHYEDIPDEDVSNERQDRRITSVIPKTGSKIKHIDLTTSEPRYGMRLWTHACRELKSFRVCGGDEIVGSVGFAEFNWLVFRNLATHKKTLERLWISPFWADVDDQDDQRVIRDFEQLKVLCLHILYVGVWRRLSDLFPPSLEVLALWGITWEWKAPWFLLHMTELISEGSLPRLKALCLCCPGPDSSLKDASPRGTETLDGLKSLCQERGIEFRIEHDEIVDYLLSIWPESHVFVNVW